MGRGRGTSSNTAKTAPGRAWWLALVGVFALLAQASGPLAHASEIARETGMHAPEGTSTHEPGAPSEPERHSSDKCGVCQTILAGANAGLVGIGGGWSAPAALCLGVAQERGNDAFRSVARDGARARGPPSDCA